MSAVHNPQVKTYTFPYADGLYYRFVVVSQAFIYGCATVICLPQRMVKTDEVIVGPCSSVSLQDEQRYRNLHEEINHLALKLEKQGKTDGKNISSRRKHINKMYTLPLKWKRCAACHVLNLQTK